MADYLTADTQLPPYLAFPRFLLELNISETAKLLYMVLLDRARLSRQNEGWTDESGRVFLFFTVRELAAVLHRSDMTVKTALSTLSTHDLIFRQRQGAGSPNRIYVKVPAQTDRNLSVVGKENCPMDGKKAVSPEARKLSPNKKENKNNEKMKQESKAAYGRYENVLLTNDEKFALQTDFPDWQERIEKLSGYMKSSGKCYRDHAATIRLWAAKEQPAAVKRSYTCKEGESL
jgi:FtsZ-binding cell division protein ZapB